MDTLVPRDFEVEVVLVLLKRSERVLRDGLEIRLIGGNEDRGTYSGHINP